MYYYLAASLPLLFYESESFPSRESFLETCTQHLSAPHLRILGSAMSSDLSPQPHSCRILDLWRRWETSLRNELVRLRAKNKGVEADEYLMDCPAVMSAQQNAREAFAQDSPLQAEEALNRARWSYLDDLEVGHYFDIEKILLYALRLQILERKALFEEQKGREMFEKVYAEITDPVGVS